MFKRNNTICFFTGRIKKMLICSKCGYELREGVLFCKKCGQSVEISKASALPEMSLEESVSYIEKLKHKFTEVERLERQLMDNEALLSKPLFLDERKYSMFRFFWPNLIWAAIAYIVMLCIAAIGTSDETAFSILMPLTFIIPIVILVIGGIRAWKRRNKENAFIAEDNEQAIEKKKKIEKDTYELRSKLATKKNDLALASAAIPEPLRKSVTMTQMKSLLQSGKASNIQEAVALLLE